MLFLILLLIVVGLPIVIAICSSKGRDYPRDYGTTRGTNFDPDRGNR